MMAHEQPLTETEQELGKALLSGKYANFAVLRGSFEDVPAAYIVAVFRNQDDSVEMYPVALLLTATLREKIGDRLIGAMGEPPSL